MGRGVVGVWGGGWSGFVGPGGRGLGPGGRGLGPGGQGCGPWWSGFGPWWSGFGPWWSGFGPWWSRLWALVVGVVGGGWSGFVGPAVPTSSHEGRALLPTCCCCCCCCCLCVRVIRVCSRGLCHHTRCCRHRNLPLLQLPLQPAATAWPGLSGDQCVRVTETVTQETITNYNNGGVPMMPIKIESKDNIEILNTDGMN